MTYLAVAYLGMLVAIALWTWTVVQRSRRLDERLKAMEGAVDERTVCKKTRRKRTKKSVVFQRHRREATGEAHVIPTWW